MRTIAIIALDVYLAIALTFSHELGNLIVGTLNADANDDPSIGFHQSVSQSISQTGTDRCGAGRAFRTIKDIYSTAIVTLYNFVHHRKGNWLRTYTHSLKEVV